MDIPALQQTFDPNGGYVEFGSDAKLFVQFRSQSMQNPLKSQEAGRPIFEAVDFIKIQQPGERDCLDRPATQMDRARFRRQWENYQQGRGDQPSGTLLVVLFPNNPEIVDNLKHDKVFTVEQLAALNDTQIQGIGMGGRSFVEAAKQLLAAADKGKDFHALSRRVDEMALKMQEKDTRIAALETALAEASDKKSTRKQAAA